MIKLGFTYFVPHENSGISPFPFRRGGLWAQAQISPVAGPGGSPAPVVSAPAAPAAPVPPDTVVAEVDGKKYTAAEVDNLMKLFPPQQQASIRSDPKRAFGLLMLMRHLAEEAEKAKLDQQSPMKETLEFGRLNALSSAELNEVRNQQVKVTPDDEMKFYKEHPDRFREAKVRVIYVAFSPPSAKADAAGKKPRSEAEAKAKIEELKGQIDGGADFGKLARENSDDKESAGKDGDFGMIRPSSAYPEAVKTAVFALKAGQVSAPVRQPNGFYLLRVDSVTTQPYDQIRTLIYDELEAEGLQRMVGSPAEAL